MGKELVLKVDEVSTPDKINKQILVKLTPNFGNVMHVNIGYDYNTCISGVKYALVIVARDE